MASRTTWLVVADGARAHFYRSADGSLTPALNHDLAAATRNPAREAESDRPGRSLDRAAEGHHAMEPPDWKTHERKQLAAAVAAELRQAMDRRAFDRLVVVAPPEMLGHMRQVFDDRLKGLVDAEMGKDLTHLSTHQLAHQLKDVLS
jgi:protein required for attachment to host cells